MVRRGSAILTGAFVAWLAWPTVSSVAGLELASALPSVPVGQAVDQPADAGAGPTATATAPAAYPAWWSASPPRLASYGSIVVAALLLLLYLYRRYPYILHWTLSWLLRAASSFIASIAVGSGALGLALQGLSHLSSIASALLLVVSADIYRGGTAFNRKYAWGALPVIIWFVLAPMGFGRQAVEVPGYLISSAILATAAAVYIVGVRRAQSLGAVLVGATLALLALSHGWTAFSAAAGEPASLELQAVNALLLLVTALGMHLMVFEEMTVELRLSNRRLEKTQDDLHQMVITDPLTGCYNRRFFNEVIGRELQRRERYHAPLSLLFLDVDRFKAVNDSFGHETGDLVLQYVAAFLKRNVREADYLFRWGGDEFLVLMSCHLGQAMQKGIDLKAGFLAAPETAQLPAGVGLSFGCTEVPEGADDVMPLVKEADRLMYVDKIAAR